MCKYVQSEFISPGYGCCRCQVYNGLQRFNCKSCGEAHCDLTLPTDLKGTYYEDGGATEVIVRAVRADEKGVSYDLETVRSVRPSPLSGEIPPGEKFTPWAAHDAGAYAGWRLATTT